MEKESCSSCLYIEKIGDRRWMCECGRVFDEPEGWSRRLRIGVFAYDFEHKKTQEGLLWLLLHGYKPDVIFSAPKVTLDFYQSKIRVGLAGMTYMHPAEIAQGLGIPYHVVVHNSKKCKDLIRKYELDVGIILGARILEENIIRAFKIGILNMHPALLPENRGMDTIKWAVLKNIKQGASCHLIDKNIDRGKLIVKRSIPVYEDDTLLDVFLRVQNMEQVLMIESLKQLESGKNDFECVGIGHYSKPLLPELEKTLMKRFEEYKKARLG